MKVQLSQHLTLNECIKSNTATQLGVSNEPTEEHIANLKLVAEHIFEPIRIHFGVPIGISSGYRSEALNKAVKGSKTSDHCFGRALDLDADIFGKLTNADIFKFVRENLEFDNLIWEFGTNTNPEWVHVSYRHGENRKIVMKAVKVNGKTSYLKA